jgi:STE24 endopeptidase
MAELPLKPFYTQSGGPGPSSDENGELSLLTYWSLAATVGFTLFVYAFEGNLDARQKASYQKTNFPKELETTVSKIDTERAKEAKQDDKKKDKDESKTLLEQLQAKFKSSQAYGLDKINFGMISSTYDTVESVVFLLLGFLPYAWDKSVEVGQTYFGLTVEDEIKNTLIFLLITTIVGTFTALPFELYSTFQIERKHGFNKMTLGLFFTDKAKSLVLSCAIGGPFVALLLKIIKMGGEYFYLYVWGFMFVFSVIMMTLVPVVIMPLFNKYETLPDGDLKTQIYKLAERLNYPLKKLFMMDGSKRSSHSNAFMFGFGSNKRIVLFDTLMEQVHDDEILAILGHELGR